MDKQIFPSTITGQSFAEGGSVLDHNFGAGEPYTLGVEEEYMLLDGETLDLVQHVEAVLAATGGHEVEPRISRRSPCSRSRRRSAARRPRSTASSASCAPT